MVKKRLVALLLLAIFMLSFCLPVSAEGTDSFTHWDTVSGNKKVVYMKDIYKVEDIISTRSLGLDTDIVIQDIVGDNKGNLYVLTETGQIIVVNSEFDFVKYIDILDVDGNIVELLEAKGIYVTDKNLFIGDTLNGRVLVCDINGNVIKELLTPDSPVIPKDFNFLPTKIAQDEKGFLYVLSDGAYYGALLFNENYEFLGFYGANTVNATVLSTLQNLWDMLTQNDTKRGNDMKKLPYQFLDIALDNKGFVYTCTADNSGDNIGQIRMLSPGGSNILSKNYGTNVLSSTAFNFAETEIAKRRGEDIIQKFSAIDVDKNGYIYALDSTYGIVYVYDVDCNLITAFGGGKGSGNRLGTFVSASALEVIGDRVYVADNVINSITVYEKTNYGNMVFEAQKLTLDGYYAQAKPIWEEVSNQDQNNLLAISGLAKAAYSEGDYEKAMEYAKISLDRVIYDQGLKKVQEEFISNNFVWVFLLIIVFLALVVSLIIVSVKKKIVFIKNEKLRLSITCCMHPFKSFNDVKYKNMGSPIIASVFTILFFLSSVISIVYTDFRFTSYDSATYNPVFQLLTTVGLVALWTVGNWAVSVLMEGKGKIKDIFIVTGYAVLPLIIYNLLYMGFSHVITSSSAVFLNGLYTISLILAGIIIVIGTMTVQEFSFPKFLISAVLTLFAMILIVFILFMIGMLLSQLSQFVTSIVMEIVYR